jgi:hypothetical protein
MNFRHLLELQGVSTRDLADALTKSRQATRWIRSASGVVVEVLTHARARVRPGGKPALVLEKGRAIAAEIHRGTNGMLERRQR